MSGGNPILFELEKNLYPTGMAIEWRWPLLQSLFNTYFCISSINLPVVDQRSTESFNTPKDLCRPSVLRIESFKTRNCYRREKNKNIQYRKMITKGSSEIKKQC
jgi:hypothetical protein